MVYIIYNDETGEVSSISQTRPETDSPYLSPEPSRHSRNEPQHLPYIIKAIASIRKMNEDRIREYTYQNALRFFRLEQEGLPAYESIKE